jgi:hypothetical protein
MRERGYQMDVNERSMVVGTNIDNADAEIYLVGLSRVRPLRCALELESDKEIVADESDKEMDADESDKEIDTDRKFKRPRRDGPSIHLGPVPNAELPPKQVFQGITTWVERAALPKTARCVGMVDDLPDWIEIAIATEDIEEFEELWGKRPAALRGVVCVSNSKAL